MKVDRCSRCKAEIVWLKTKNAKSMPVDKGSVTEGDTLYDHARHVSHFATCKFAAQFRKK